MDKNEVEFLNFLKDKNAAMIILTNGYDVTICKIKYNDRFYIITHNYGELNMEKDKIQIAGIYDRDENLMYLSNEYCVREFCGSMYKSRIDNLVNTIIKESNNKLADYIYGEEYETLKDLGRPIYTKYFSDERHVFYFNAQVESKYERNEEITPIQWEMDFRNYSNNLNNISELCSYLEDREKFLQNKLEIYLKQTTMKRVSSPYAGTSDIECSLKEYIGFELLSKNREVEIYNKLLNDINNPLNKRRNISKSIEDNNMKFVNVTFRVDNETLTVKYPTMQLKSGFMSDWYVKEVDLRDEYKKLFEGQRRYTDSEIINCIEKITYGKKILFEA